MATLPPLNYLGQPLALSKPMKTLITGTSAAELLYGTSSDDGIDGKGGADTISGGAGDDTYIVQYKNTVVTEAAGGGIDTVRATTNFVLPDNVENLRISGFSTYRGTSGTGNDLANWISGDANPQFLDGGRGNDVLTGGGGSDTFIFRAGTGNDVVDDFQAGPTASGGDVLSLQGYTFRDFAAFQAAATQVGADTVVKLSASDSATLRNVKLSDLTEANVLLSLDRSNLKLAFGDEFSGTSPDLRTAENPGGLWIPEYGFGGIGSKASHYVGAYTGEEAIFVDPSWGGSGTTPLGLDPFEMEDGILTIDSGNVPDAARPSLWNTIDYYSGLLSTATTYKQTYGYFEMRAQMSPQSGAWNTFWLVRPKTQDTPMGEIDIFEVYGDGANVIRTTAHDPDLPNGKLGSGTYIPDATTAFHTYGVLWTASKITWYIDDRQVFQIDTPADMHAPMYVVASLNVGAVGGPIDPNNLPTDYKIDYIRTYSLDQRPDVPGDSPTVPGKTILGTAAAEVLEGGAGNDMLDGAGGIDTLSGGAGDDTYIVNHSKEAVIEAAGGGDDTIRTSVSYALAADQQVEHLVATGSAMINLTGNAYTVDLIGNGAANTLDGGDASVAHRLVGGGGNDVFVVRHAGDAVVEAVNSGYDTVKTDLASYTLTANVEVLTYTGSSDFRGTGNASSNLILGGTGADTLDGGAGNDRLVGGKGNDTYIVDSAADAVVENAGEGYDTQITSVNARAGANVELLVYSGSAKFTGYANNTGTEIRGGTAADMLVGGNGADKLIGNGGADVFTGGAGADTFHFNQPGTSAIRVTDFVHGEDHFALDAATFGVDSLSQLALLTGTATSAAPAGGPALIYDPAGKLYFDENGGNGADRVLVATLDKAPMLSVSDFLLV